MNKVSTKKFSKTAKLTWDETFNIGVGKAVDRIMDS